MNRFDTYLLQIKAEVFAIAFTVFGAWSFIEIVNATKAIVLFLLAVASGSLAFYHWRLKIKIAKKELELKDQELGERLLKSRHSQNGKA